MPYIVDIFQIGYPYLLNYAPFPQLLMQFIACSGTQHRTIWVLTIYTRVSLWWPQTANMLIYNINGLMSIHQYTNISSSFQSLFVLHIWRSDFVFIHGIICKYELTYTSSEGVSFCVGIILVLCNSLRTAAALNKRLSKQSRSQWFETPSCPLWRHCNV